MSDMATGTSKNCEICENEYDETLRRPRYLPCGHSYCSNCLIQIAQTANKLCPYCRYNWNNIQVENLPVCFQLLPESNPIGEGKDNAPEKCEEHNLEMVFWCQNCEEEACKRCLSKDHRKCDWLLVEEAITQLSSDLQVASDGNIRKHLESTVERFLAELEDNMLDISSFKQSVENLQNEMKIDQVKLLSIQTQLLEGSKTSGTIEHKTRGKIREILRCKKASHSLPKQQEKQTPLWIVITNYQALKGRTNDAEFLEALGSNLVQAKHAASSDIGTETRLANEPPTQHAPPLETKLSDGGVWDISDNVTAAEAVNTLKNTSKRPREAMVTIPVGTAWRQQDEAALLPAIASKTGDVRLQFMDSFYAPTQATLKTDEARLNNLLIQTRRCMLKEFIGHLDCAGLQKLPNTVQCLGLAVTEPKDWEIFPSLWYRTSYYFLPYYDWWLRELTDLHVSVSKTAKEVSIPGNVYRTTDSWRLYLHFYAANNEDLNWVVDVTDKINGWYCKANRLKSSRNFTLCLPASRLTEADADHLLGLLRDRGLTPTIRLESLALRQPAQIRLQQRFLVCGMQIICNMTGVLAGASHV